MVEMVEKGMGELETVSEREGEGEAESLVRHAESACDATE